jgi:hypothetical protein
MQRHGDNPYSLARKLGDVRKQPQLHRYLEGQAKEPRRSTLQPVADHYNVPLDAFYDETVANTVARALSLEKEGSGIVGSPANRTLPAIGTKPATRFGNPTATQGSDELDIPQYAAAGAMGNGGLVLEERQPGLIKSWRVDHEWLRLNVRHHTGVSNLCIVTGFGPSMKPKYNPGDPLLLDRGVVTVETEGIYFFRVGNHGFIKQLQRIPTEAGMIIRAKSLNRNYDPFDITEKMDFEVFGKILTVWKSEQV